MGSVVKSALPDPVRLAITDASLPAFAESFSKLPKRLIPGTGERKAFLRQSQNFLTAVNGQIRGRAHALSEVSEEIYIGNTKGLAEKSGEFVSSFFNHNGNNWWNDTWQGMAAELTYTEIGDTIERVAKGLKERGDIGKLRASGIDPDRITEFKKFFDDYDVKDNNLRRLAIEEVDMSDAATREIFEIVQAAVNRDVDITIVNPGPGDKPIFLSSTFGSTIGQYKSFGYGSLQRSTLNYAQRLRRNPRDIGYLHCDYRADCAGYGSGQYQPSYSRAPSRCYGELGCGALGYGRCGPLRVARQLNRQLQHTDVPHRRHNAVSRRAGR